MLDTWPFHLATGYTMLALAGLIAICNFYLSFLRYPIHKLLRRPYRFVSGLPGIGTFLAGWATVILLFHQCWIALWMVFALLALDTGGIPWFLGTMIWFHFHPPKDQ